MKATIEPTAPAAKNAVTAARSSVESSTSGASSGVLSSATRLADQTKKAWPKTMPRTIKNGAGDSPTKEMGAASLASTKPQALRLLKPKRMQAMASADNTTPTKSMLMPRVREMFFRRKLRIKTASEMATISQNETRQFRAVAMKPATTKVSPLATAGMPARMPNACSC